MSNDTDQQSEAAVAETSAPGTGAIERVFRHRLEQVFRRLREHDIPFCVLRNRDRIPRGLMQGSDVDVIVPAGTRARELVRIMWDLQPAHVVPHRSTLELYFPAGPLFLHVDFLIADREWRGARYLKNADILEAAGEDDGIPMASTPHQAFCAWFSSLTRRRRFKPRYIPLISAAVREAPQSMAALLGEAFGRGLGNDLLRLAERGELEHADRFAGRCRRAIWLRALCRRPLATLRGLLGHYVAEATLWVRPTGLAVAVLGPDGSGKSAVCSALASASRAVLPFTAVSVQHLYERALPRLSELKKGRMRRTPAAPATVHDPHGKRAHNLLVSLLTLTYSTVDQWLSRWLFGRARLGGNKLLVHDRYMIEIVVDPKRFRYGGPRSLGGVFCRLTPPLDLVILLDAPPEVLQARKQEVPFAETSRQRETYRALIGSMPNGRIVKADRPLEQVIADVEREVTQCLADRTARRFRLGPVTQRSAAEASATPVAFGLCGEGYSR
jgi:thymidylate kinase